MDVKKKYFGKEGGKGKRVWKGEKENKEEE